MTNPDPSRVPGAEPLSPDELTAMLDNWADSVFPGQIQVLRALRELQALRAERTAAPASGAWSTDGGTWIAVPDEGTTTSRQINVRDPINAFELVRIHNAALASSLTPQQDVEALAHELFREWLARVPPAPQPAEKHEPPHVHCCCKPSNLAGAPNFGIYCHHERTWVDGAAQQDDYQCPRCKNRISVSVSEWRKREPVPPAPAAQARSAGRVEDLAFELVQVVNGFLGFGRPIRGSALESSILAVLQRARETGDAS